MKKVYWDTKMMGLISLKGEYKMNLVFSTKLQSKEKKPFSRRCCHRKTDCQVDQINSAKWVIMVSFNDMTCMRFLEILYYFATVKDFQKCYKKNMVK